MRVRVAISYSLMVMTAASAYGPFYGNRDLLCNRGTRYACYCSTVTWRRFNRTDAPLCSQLFPGFEAAILEMATCDVRLESSQLSQTATQDDQDVAGSATTVERYFKRALATLIRKECHQSPNEPHCVRIPSDLNEEHIVFTSYECSKDLTTSRLWMVIIGKSDSAVNFQETAPQEETRFVDGNSIARVLTSAAVLPQLNSHLIAKNSRVMNVHHSRLDETYKRTNVPKASAAERDSGPNHGRNRDPNSDHIPDPDRVRDSDQDIVRVQAVVAEEEDKERRDDVVVEYETESDTPNAEGRAGEEVDAEDTNARNPSWVPILIGTLFAVYFVIVWILSVIFCMKKQNEIQAKNRRLRGEARDRGIQDEQNRRVDFDKDPVTTKKLMSRDEDSDYDNK